MTNKEAVNWLINLMADIGKAQFTPLWHYEQPLMEIRELLESLPEQNQSFDEARQEFMNLVYDELHGDGDNNRANRIIDAADCYAEEYKPNWTPCSEGLPEYSGRYLASVLDGIDRRTTVVPYHPRSRAWTLTGRMAYWKVIAWMPLPEPYKEVTT